MTTKGRHFWKRKLGLALSLAMALESPAAAFGPRVARAEELLTEEALPAAEEETAAAGDGAVPSDAALSSGAEAADTSGAAAAAQLLEEAQGAAREAELRLQDPAASVTEPLPGEASGEEAILSPAEGEVAASYEAGGAWAGDVQKDSPAEAWSAIVAAGGGTVKLGQDWIADDTEKRSFGAGTGFNDEGGIQVPEGMNITLDLNGHLIDRHLTTYAKADAYWDGYSVITVGKKAALTIVDSAPGEKHSGFYVHDLWFPLERLDEVRGKNGESSTTAVDIRGGIITGGAATYGGGIYLDTGADLFLKGGSIVGNAAKNGGGLYAYKAYTEMSGGMVGYNWCYDYGGGVYTESSTSKWREQEGTYNSSQEFFLKGGSIQGNTAADCGGGVYVEASSGAKAMRMTGGAVSGNRAYSKGMLSNEGGGGIYQNQGRVELKGGIIYGNEAVECGGGVYANGYTGNPINGYDCYVDISGTSIMDNNASYGGGFYVNTKYAMISGGVIVNNRATAATTLSGGGVYVADLDYLQFGSGAPSIIQDNFGGGENSVPSDVCCQNFKDLNGSENYALSLASGSCVYLQFRNSSEVKDGATFGERLSAAAGALQMDDKNFYVAEDTSGAVSYPRWVIRRVTGEESKELSGAKSYTPYPGSDTYAVKRGTFHYTSALDAGDMTGVYYYTDAMFTDREGQGAKDFDHHLATMSFNFAMSGFRRPFPGNPEAQGRNARELLEDLGYKDVKLYYPDPERKGFNDYTIGCAIGRKTLTEGDRKGQDMVAVTIRGANYMTEWGSNVTINGKDSSGEYTAEGEAAGFANAADQVKARIDAYLNEFGLKGEETCFWVTGFSRAGATANLTSRRLVDAYDSASGGTRVYGYCNEAPQGGNEKAYPGAYLGIHNIINPADLVPQVAPTIMGFKRYGVDHLIPGDTDVSDNSGTHSQYRSVGGARYQEIKKDMLKQLAAIDPRIGYIDRFQGATMSYAGSTAFGWSLANPDGAVMPAEDWYGGFMKNLVNYCLNPQPRVGSASNYPADAEGFRKLYNRLWYVKEIDGVPQLVSQGDSGAKRFSIQDALEKVIVLVFGLDQATTDRMNNALSGVGNEINRGFKTTDGENLSMKTLWMKFIMKWLADKELAEKNKQIRQLWELVDTAKLETILPEEHYANLKEAFPILVDFALQGVSYDYNYNNQNYLGTLVYNLKAIGQGHYPEVNLAWLRAQDDFYTEESDQVIGRRAPLAMPADVRAELVDHDASRLETSGDGAAQYVGTEVKLALTSDGSTIVYSMDGRDPKPGEYGTRVYDGPITLTSDGSARTSYRIRYRAYKGGAVSVDGLYAIDLTKEVPRYPLTVTTYEGKSSTVQYKEGDQVRIDAYPGNIGAELDGVVRFKGWKAEGVALGNAGAASTTFVMPAQAVAVEAEYQPLVRSIYLQTEDVAKLAADTKLEWRISDGAENWCSPGYSGKEGDWPTLELYPTVTALQGGSSYRIDFASVKDAAFAYSTRSDRFEATINNTKVYAGDRSQVSLEKDDMEVAGFGASEGSPSFTLKIKEAEEPEALSVTTDLVDVVGAPVKEIASGETTVKTTGLKAGEPVVLYAPAPLKSEHELFWRWEIPTEIQVLDASGAVVQGADTGFDNGRLAYYTEVLRFKMPTAAPDKSLIARFLPEITKIACTVDPPKAESWPVETAQVNVSIVNDFVVVSDCIRLSWWPMESDGTLSFDEETESCDLYIDVRPDADGRVRMTNGTSWPPEWIRTANDLTVTVNGQEAEFIAGGEYQEVDEEGNPIKDEAGNIKTGYWYPAIHAELPVERPEREAAEAPEASDILRNHIDYARGRFLNDAGTYEFTLDRETVSRDKSIDLMSVASGSYSSFFVRVAETNRNLASAWTEVKLPGRGAAVEAEIRYAVEEVVAKDGARFQYRFSGETDYRETAGGSLALGSSGWDGTARTLWVRRPGGGEKLPGMESSIEIPARPAAPAISSLEDRSTEQEKGVAVMTVSGGDATSSGLMVQVRYPEGDNTWRAYGDDGGLIYRDGDGTYTLRGLTGTKTEVRVRFAATDGTPAAFASPWSEARIVDLSSATEEEEGDALKVYLTGVVKYTALPHKLKDDPAAHKSGADRRGSYDLSLSIVDHRIAGSPYELVLGTDYKVTYKNNTNASMNDDFERTVKDERKLPQVVIKGLGTYRDLAKTVYFDICPVSIGEESGAAAPFAGGGIKDTYILKKQGGISLTVKPKHYRRNYDTLGETFVTDHARTVAYKTGEISATLYQITTDGKEVPLGSLSGSEARSTLQRVKDPGTYAVRYEGKGNYSGSSDQESFEVYAADVVPFTSLKAKTTKKPFDANGVAATDLVTGLTGKGVRVDGTEDLEILLFPKSGGASTEMRDGIYYATAAGVYDVQIFAKESFEKKHANVKGGDFHPVWAEVTVTGKKLASGNIAVAWDRKGEVYDGKPKSVTVTLKGSISASDVRPAKQEIVNGKAVWMALSDEEYEKAVKVTKDGFEIAGSYELDDTAEVSNAAIGTHVLALCGMGQYGSSVITYKLKRTAPAIRAEDCTAAPAVFYVGGATTTMKIRQPDGTEVSVSGGGDSSYRITYRKNKSVGTATAVVRVVGNGTGFKKGSSASVSFEVKEAEAVLRSYADFGRSAASGVLYAQVAGDVAKGAKAPKLTLWQADATGRKLAKVPAKYYKAEYEAPARTGSDGSYDLKVTSGSVKGLDFGQGLTLQYAYREYGEKAKKWGSIAYTGKAAVIRDTGSGRVYTSEDIRETMPTVAFGNNSVKAVGGSFLLPIVKEVEVDGTKLNEETGGFVVSYQRNDRVGTAKLTVTLTPRRDGTYPIGGSKTWSFKIVK